MPAVPQPAMPLPCWAARAARAALCLTLLVSAGQPSSAAPWDGIVGFLQTVAQLHNLRTDTEYPAQEPQEPLRRIVYSVEEQLSLSPGHVVFDSAAPANQTQSSSRLKRSSAANTTDTHKQEGRNAATNVNRPIFIGRKLWYAPLWFGLYLIVYLLVLTVKSVARHRIRYPNLVPLDKSGRRRGDYSRVNGLTNGVENSVTSASRRYRHNWK